MKYKYNKKESNLCRVQLKKRGQLNMRVTGIPESLNVTPAQEGRTLCTKLEYSKEEPVPFTKSWRLGKDATKA